MYLVIFTSSTDEKAKNNLLNVSKASEHAPREEGKLSKRLLCACMRILAVRTKLLIGFSRSNGFFPSNNAI